MWSMSTPGGGSTSAVITDRKFKSTERPQGNERGPSVGNLRASQAFTADLAVSIGHIKSHRSHFVRFPLLKAGSRNLIVDHGSQIAIWDVTAWWPWPI